MKAVGIILAGGNNERLRELTALRATSAIPVGGCYRAIDFSLSNMSNSGIKKVAVITQYNSRSLHDHLNSSKWWDLGRKYGGLFIFTPFLSKDSSMWFRGTADSIYQNITYLKRSNEQYVVIASGDGIYKMDYRKMIRYHEEKEADITLACTKQGQRDGRKYGMIEYDENNYITNFEEKPLEVISDNISMGVYVLERTLLIKLLETIISEDRFDIVRDIIVRYRKVLKLYAYDFEGYWNTPNSIEAYFNINMDFLKKEVREDFTKEYPNIESKPKDEPPAKYNSGAYVKNALVGSGAILNGTVHDSVLFRKVYTGENSSIKKSIIMEASFIGNNCIVENAIIDKEVVLSDGCQIIGEEGKPVIIAKGSVL